jgi:hypothetical protein
VKARNISASSYKTYYDCGFRYFLTYELGIRTPPGAAASKGNLAHLAAELAATHVKETGKISYPLDFFDRANLELDKEDQKQLNTLDKLEVKRWLQNHRVEFQDYFSKKILAAEQEFNLIFDKNLRRIDDVTVPEYWLNLPHCDKFSIKGFMDLVLLEDEDTLNIVDFKTGKPKSEAALRKDIQPQMYFVAASYLYPNIKNIILTFDYLKAQPIPITFHREEIAIILQKIYTMHLEAINTTVPKRPSRPFWLCNYCVEGGYSGENCAGNYNKYFNGRVLNTSDLDTIIENYDSKQEIVV